MHFVWLQILSIHSVSKEIKITVTIQTVVISYIDEKPLPTPALMMARELHNGKKNNKKQIGC